MSEQRPPSALRRHRFRQKGGSCARARRGGSRAQQGSYRAQRGRHAGSVSGHSNAPEHNASPRRAWRDRVARGAAPPSKAGSCRRAAWIMSAVWPVDAPAIDRGFWPRRHRFRRSGAALPAPKARRRPQQFRRTCAWYETNRRQEQCRRRRSVARSRHSHRRAERP